MMRLSLAQAVKENRLPEFISQQESMGVGAINRSEFDSVVEAAVTQPQSQGQTSGSPAHGGSSGKKTR
jgi:hypothetical protein